MKKPVGQELFKKGIVKKNDIEKVDELHESFPVRAPFEYISKIREHNSSDPLWKTVIPSESELLEQEFERLDPIGDQAFSPIKGIVHRHRDRVLFMPTNICAMYCRFCFRRDVVGKPGISLSKDEVRSALDYIRKHKEIWEVIFSGGDPFVLPNAKLRSMLMDLEEIEHVKVIRFHTRIVIADPNRIDSTLLRILKHTLLKRKAVYIVTHINHVQEINASTEEACFRLINRGIPLLNQSVLLKGVNDNFLTMETLLRKLVEMRIKPYYLHHPDLTKGTNHFRLTISEGQELMKRLRMHTSGLCVPSYMLDIPGGNGKIPIEGSYIRTSAEGSMCALGHDGEMHIYPSY